MINVDGQTETKYYYFRDALGSVVALLNNNGVVVEGYSYDSFGRTTIHTAAGADGKWLTGDDSVGSVSSVANRLMFTGREYDSETGNYYFRARYYKPSIGRFLQTDPIGYADGLNMYTYCSNNPIMWIDPWGLCREAGDEVIDDEDWDEYENGVYDDVQSKSMLIQTATYDTRYKGANMHGGAAAQKYYYVERYKMRAQGSEINYTGQGMMDARFGAGKAGGYGLMYGWKIAGIVAQQFPWYKPDPPYRLPTENERFFMNQSIKDYNRLIQKRVDRLDHPLA
jgi:RHS repeat-associated protein